MSLTDRYQTPNSSPACRAAIPPRMGWRSLAVAALAVVVPGCASWTNPVANGVPVRLLPPELLAESKEELVPIPLKLLKRPPPGDYELGPGDVLGVYVDGVLGNPDQLPPVSYPDSQDLPPALGFPIPVRQDGTLALPLVKPVHVAGLTLPAAHHEIVKAYTQEKKIVKQDESRILLTMMRPRQARVTVIREDSAEGPSQAAISPTSIAVTPATRTAKRGQGMNILLAANQADVLSALAETGGMPGSDAVNEIVIERGHAAVPGLHNPYEHTRYDGVRDQGPERIRIPLRLPPGAEIPFGPEDVTLHDGDIVFVAARQADVFYTGGLLGSREVPLPRDYDLGVVEAVTSVGATILNGGVNGNNLSGNLIGVGIGNPSPSLLTVIRQVPGTGKNLRIRVDLNEALRDPRENVLVRAGDILILQETPGESLTRYLSNIFILDFFADGNTTSSAAAVSLP